MQFLLTHGSAALPGCTQLQQPLPLSGRFCVMSLGGWAGCMSALFKPLKAHKAVILFPVGCFAEYWSPQNWFSVPFKWNTNQNRLLGDYITTNDSK